MNNIDKLIVFGNFEKRDKRLLKDMSFVIDNYTDGTRNKDELCKLFCSCVSALIDMAVEYGFYGNLWHCFLTFLLVKNENAFSLSCEGTGSPGASLNAAAIHDMKLLRTFFDYPVSDCERALGADTGGIITCYEPVENAGSLIDIKVRDEICALADKLYESREPGLMLNALCGFYKSCGAGDLGLYKAFRLSDKVSGDAIKLIPIPDISDISLSDLVGYESAKKKLIENTEAFIEGKKANNCLLFGDAGTGKSSSVKALLNRYSGDGLRIIEIYKHEFIHINKLIARIRNRNYKFIIFMDDLSFEEFETEYKYLKAVIEGGLEKKPLNVLIYATSNRRHLVKESFSDGADRDDVKHKSDTIEEKLSLAGRFGITIYFGSPDKKEFQAIVKSLAQKENIEMSDEELFLEANKWELSHAGRSGRTARQFVDHLSGLK